MITIIGGSGFIGSALCRLLKSKSYSFNIIDKVKSDLYPDLTNVCDINSKSFLNDIKLSKFVINLAAEHRDDVHPLSLYHQTNVLGAIAICKLASENDTQTIIFTSSVAVYGFAPLETDEHGSINPFNEYGKTKWNAEQVYRDWQLQDPIRRALVIIRPTVVFGERNRGNVFNLLKQIASGNFVMVGDGLNRKSMAYVENVAAFLEYSLDFKPGIHIYNYIDKPDFTMNTLVGHVNKLLGRSVKINFRIPFSLGLLIGSGFDLVAKITSKKFPISAIRVKKFCANSVYGSAIESTGFIPPVPLMDAIEKTVRFEFIDDHKAGKVFHTE